MKKTYLITVLLLLFISLQTLAQDATGNFTKHAAKKWFNKKEWLHGADLKPHASIDKQVFAREYLLNKKYWDEAFIYLATHDLDSLPKGKYVIDGDNVTVSVTTDSTKDFEKTKWESHKKYIDLQCVISGEEKMGVWPVEQATVIKAYDEKKDVANYNAEGRFYVAGARTFFIFFPGDAHRPNIAPDGNKPEKKIVIKIRVA